MHRGLCLPPLPEGRWSGNVLDNTQGVMPLVCNPQGLTVCFLLCAKRHSLSGLGEVRVLSGQPGPSLLSPVDPKSAQIHCML